MKAHLTKVSLALLSTVFLLACQDLGSDAVGPDGPQFDKRGDPGALCGGEGGPVRDENGHCHGDEESTEVPIYTISLEADGRQGGRAVSHLLPPDDDAQAQDHLRSGCPVLDPAVASR